MTCPSAAAAVVVGHRGDRDHLVVGRRAIESGVVRFVAGGHDVDRAASTPSGRLPGGTRRASCARSRCRFRPPKLMLMLATSNSGRAGLCLSRCDVTQSTPQISHDIRPVPCGPRTLTDQIRAPGATPTTPKRLSIAPTMPATCVPCPSTSSQLFAVAAGAVVAADDVEVRMIALDARVDDGHVGVDTRVAAVDTSDGVVLGANSSDAGRDV